MNISDLVAIDMHVHIEADGHGHTDMPEDFREAARQALRHLARTAEGRSVAAHYRERNMAAVVFTVDHESQTGHPPISNREIAAPGGQSIRMC